MKYAITGVTGHFGSVAVQTLAQLVPKDQIVALARNVAKAKKIVPEGVEVRPGDYTQPGDLHNALKDVDKLLLVSSQPGGALPRVQEHLNVITAAKNMDVKYIAYTSFPHADTARGSLAYDHKMTEKALENSGIPYSFLRNNWYLENEKAMIQGALKGAPFTYSAQDGHVGWTLERFYAEAAAKVLVADDPKPIYEFAGAPQTYANLAAAVQKLAAQPFEVEVVNDDQYQAQLQAAGVPKPAIEALVVIQMLIREGDLDEQTNDLENVLGRPLPTLEAALKELLEAK